MFVNYNYFIVLGIMELKYVIMTLIKILASVPTIVLLCHIGLLPEANGAALMGGHFDNQNSTKNISNPFIMEYDSYEMDDISQENSTVSKNFLAIKMIL